MKEPVPKEGTKRVRKVAMPQADKSDKIPAVHLPQIRHPLT